MPLPHLYYRLVRAVDRSRAYDHLNTGFGHHHCLPWLKPFSWLAAAQGDAL